MGRVSGPSPGFSLIDISRVRARECRHWATPLVVEQDGKAQVITNGTKRVRSYDLKSGKLIWECGGQASNPIPSPVRQDNLVICMTGYRGYAVFAMPLSATGDITGSDKVAWSTKETGPYVSSPALYGGNLYFTKSRDSALSILNAKTGEALVDQERIPGLRSLYASPVAAADRIYFTDRNGTTVVLKHGPTLEVLATNSLPDGIDASPAIAGKQMFIRTQKHLYCLAE